MNLRDYKKMTNKTLKQLSLEFGICFSTVHKIVKKELTPSLRLAARIEDATRGQVKMRDLLPDKEKEAA